MAGRASTAPRTADRAPIRAPRAVSAAWAAATGASEGLRAPRARPPPTPQGRERITPGNRVSLGRSRPWLARPPYVRHRRRRPRLHPQRLGARRPHGRPRRHRRHRVATQRPAQAVVAHGPLPGANEFKPMFPDFLVFRRQGAGLVCDILEPHAPAFADSVPKAKRARRLRARPRRRVRPHPANRQGRQQLQATRARRHRDTRQGSRRRHQRPPQPALRGRVGAPSNDPWSLPWSVRHRAYRPGRATTRR